MKEELTTAVEFLVYFCIGLSVLVGLANNRFGSLKLAIANRWARWLGVSFGLAYLGYEFEWMERPFWALVIVFFLGWLLLETVYNWFAISALSKSGIALFPRFRVNHSGEEWPVSKQSIVLRDWLRSADFVKSQALVAEIGNGIFIRSSVYQSKDERVRAQVLFIPMSNGSLSANVSFSSDEEGGRRLVTDNLFMPYGGFYPENWEVHRKPWIRSAKTLYNVHAKYIRNRNLQPFEVDPIDDLNQQQSLLERTNVNEGFLVPLHLQEEYGRITWEGRYRVWKEVWLLNYFGIANRA